MLFRSRVDTNKLPRLDAILEAKKNAAPEMRLVEKPINRVEPLPETTGGSPVEFERIDRIRIKAEHLEIEATEAIEPYADEIEDLAPISMRFGAGLFDLIIGGFVSMLLLSPVAFSGANWLTPLGALLFAGVTAVVMFVYKIGRVHV